MVRGTHLELQTAVLAHCGLLRDSVELDILDRMSKGATSSVTNRDSVVDNNHISVGDVCLCVTSVLAVLVRG